MLKTLSSAAVMIGALRDISLENGEKMLENSSFPWLLPQPEMSHGTLVQTTSAQCSLNSEDDMCY